MFPKARLDALNDGIFSVAMTLLALDIGCPRSSILPTAASFCKPLQSSGRNSCPMS